MSFLGFLMLVPLFLVLSALLKLAVARPWLHVLPWLGAAYGLALVGCWFGHSLPAVRGHNLWPQVAAATGAFLAFVSVWSIAMMRLRRT